MTGVGWIILIFCSASHISAQASKKCSAPVDYPHTRLDGKFSGRQGFSSGEKVYYNCAEDFTPSRGSRSAQCVKGQWTKLTLKCEKKSCGNAGDLPNGLFHYEGNSVIGEKVYAICNDGYTLKGRNYMTCKKSGWTGDIPTCEEGETTCPAPAVTNSVNGSAGAATAAAYRVGDNVTFTCSRGFQLDGAQWVTCGPDGQWRPQPPQCLPTPDRTSNKGTGGCDVPLTIGNSNGNLADKYLTMRSFASGDRVSYTCDVGYVKAGGSRYRTCKSGQWTPLFLKCEPKLCGSAGEILNGQFTYTGVEFGDTATAACDEGYILVGKKTRNCLSNGWDGRVPACEAVDCAEPPEATNAERTARQETPFTYRSVVRYRCRVGALVGQKEIWCTENGTWSAPPPTCAEITCPSPNVTRAYWMGAQNNLYRHRDTVSIECDPGYAMIGPSTVTCGPDGRWSPGLPQCRLKMQHNYRMRY